MCKAVANGVSLRFGSIQSGVTSGWLFGRCALAIVANWAVLLRAVIVGSEAGVKSYRVEGKDICDIWCTVSNGAKDYESDMGIVCLG